MAAATPKPDPVRGNLLDLYGIFHSSKIKKVEGWQSIRAAVRRRVVSRRVKGLRPALFRKS